MDLPVADAAAGVASVLLVAGGVLGAAKHKSLRAFVAALTTETPQALRQSIEALSVVVNAQGQSIDWLRGELDQAKQDLEKARTELAEARAQHASIATQAHAENAALRKRIAELEEQVRLLEEQLARRRSTTTRKPRVRAQEPE